MTTTVIHRKTIEAEYQVPDSSGLVTTTVLNTKIGKAEKKIPNHNVVNLLNYWVGMYITTK